MLDPTESEQKIEASIVETETNKQTNENPTPHGDTVHANRDHKDIAFYNSRHTVVRQKWRTKTFEIRIKSKYIDTGYQC